MNTETITTLIAALGGVTLGGLISYFSSVKLKTKEWQLTTLSEELNKRSNLYSDFLVEAQNLVLISFQKKHSDICSFNNLNKYYAQIELISDENVSDEAKSIVRHIINCHSANPEEDNKSFADIRKAFVHQVKIETSKLKSI